MIIIIINIAKKTIATIKTPNIAPVPHNTILPVATNINTAVKQIKKKIINLDYLDISFLFESYNSSSFTKLN